MKTEGGTVSWLIIHRYKCKHCGRVHSAVPDCLARFKHYTADIIASVIDGRITEDDLDVEDYPCGQTMMLWKAWFQLNIQFIEGYLRSVQSRILNDSTAFDHTEISLLEKLRKQPDWLRIVNRIICNSGGALSPC